MGSYYDPLYTIHSSICIPFWHALGALLLHYLHTLSETQFTDPLILTFESVNVIVSKTVWAHPDYKETEKLPVSAIKV